MCHVDTHTPRDRPQTIDPTSRAEAVIPTTLACAALPFQADEILLRITYVPGKNLHTADALSQEPIENDLSR